MLSNCYYFELIDGVYKQYPLDYTQEFFQKDIVTKIVSNAQVIAHRRKNLMYYTYVKQLDNGIIGGCFLLNSVMLSDVSSIFDCFESLLCEWYKKGYIFDVNDALSYRLLENKEEAVKNIITNVSSLESQYAPLLPLSYGKGYEMSVFKIGDNVKRIQESSCVDNFCIVKKNSNPQWLVDVIADRKNKQLLSQDNTKDKAIRHNNDICVDASHRRNECEIQDYKEEREVDYKYDIQKDHQEQTKKSVSRKSNNFGCLFIIILSLLFGPIIGVLGYVIIKVFYKSEK